MFEVNLTGQSNVPSTLIIFTDLQCLWFARQPNLITQTVKSNALPIFTV